MPSDHRLRLYYKECIPPFEESCEDSQADSSCGVYPPWPDTVLFEQSPDQKNYLTVEQGGQRSGLIFDARHPLLPLSPP